ncbi:MAG TPA: M14 family zinc carboxypeptidase [Acidimicrobiales bacterium]
MPYLNVDEVESALIGLADAYPAICELIVLPNPTIDGRTTRAVRIGKFGAADRDAFLVTGGVHAREWGSCEIAINVAADLCEAYVNGTGIGYGGAYFASTEVCALIEGANLVVFADVNPDGRHFSQTTEALWRRNRNPVDSGGNASCIGVDLNRNQDFLWDFPVHFDAGSGVNTSADPCSLSQTYRGSAPTSEPETKNVVWLMDAYPRIRWYLDLHSHGQDILHSWGDDENQSTDASKNFANAAFDGQRGVAGDAYGEYIPSSDSTAVIHIATAFHDQLLAVRGKDYSVEPAYSLYPTSGANDDFAYSRSFVDPSKNPIYSYTVEWGTEFQPPWPEMELVVADVSAGILGFCLEAICSGSFAVTLQTPSVLFNDVPENEVTARAIVFSVVSCGTASFQIVAGPAVTSGPGSFGTLPSPNAALPAVSSISAREARLWLSFTGMNDGDITAGEVTVRLVETGEQWVIPISANTIARPTVACVLVLDQSGSMQDPSGLSGFPTRNDVLKFAAPVFVNLLQANNGIGVVDFDHDAYDRMAVQTAGPPSAFDPARATALGVIAAHAPNPAGMTAIGDGVEHAHNLLAATAGFDNQAMIVFTDGFETASKYIADVTGLINERVFAIGLGTADQVKPTALTALTNGTGGYLLLTGALGPDDLFRLSKYYLQILAGVTNQDIVLDPEGAIKPGQKQRIPFDLNEADIGLDAILLGETNLPVFQFALETPAGDVITPAVSGPGAGIDYVTAQGVSFYRGTLPLPIGTAGARAGRWHALLTLDETYYKRYLSTLDRYPDWYQSVLAHGIRYSLSVQSYSGLRLQGQLLQTSLEPGATLTVRAVLTEYGLPIPGSRATVRAEYSRPDGTTGLLALVEADLGSGIYTGSTVAPLPGVYPFRVLAGGSTMRGRAFTREHLLTGAVWTGGDNPPPTTTDDPQTGKDQICQLLSCLLSEKVIRPEFAEQLLAAGLDLNTARKCLQRWCRPPVRPLV